MRRRMIRRIRIPDKVCKADFIDMQPVNRCMKNERNTVPDPACLRGKGRELQKKGGKKVGAANLLASSDQDVDFFIHGVFSYELFGQTF